MTALDAPLGLKQLLHVQRCHPMASLGRLGSWRWLQAVALGASCAAHGSGFYLSWPPETAAHPHVSVSQAATSAWTCHDSILLQWRLTWTSPSAYPPSPANEPDDLTVFSWLRPAWHSAHGAARGLTTACPDQVTW